MKSEEFETRLKKIHEELTQVIKDFEGKNIERPAIIFAIGYGNVKGVMHSASIVNGNLVDLYDLLEVADSQLLANLIRFEPELKKQFVNGN